MRSVSKCYGNTPGIALNLRLTWDHSFASRCRGPAGDICSPFCWVNSPACPLQASKRPLRFGHLRGLVPPLQPPRVVLPQGAREPLKEERGPLTVRLPLDLHRSVRRQFLEWRPSPYLQRPPQLLRGILGQAREFPKKRFLPRKQFPHIQENRRSRTHPLSSPDNARGALIQLQSNSWALHAAEEALLY